MGSPIVSVIVPVYNAERYLEECIKSILEQTLKDIEIILINDGSTDNSEKICKKYADIDSRIILLSQKNQGPSSARNNGINHAKGEYVSFVDSDDILCTDMLQSLVDEAQKNRSDITICNHYRLFGSNLKPQNRHIRNNIILKGRTDIAVFQNKFLIKKKKEYQPYFYYAGAPWARLYRRDLLNNNGIRFAENVKRTEDGIFNLYALQNSNVVIILASPLYIYRELYSSLSHGDCADIVKITEEDFKELKKFAAKYKNDDLLFKKGVDIRITTWVYKYLSTHFFTKSYIDKNGFKKAVSELNKLMNREPYSTAYKNVDFNLLSKSQKVFVFCLKHRMYRLLYIMILFREKYKNGQW